MRNVMMKTQELAEAILESEVYQKMKLREREAQQNEEASAVLQDMIDKRHRVEEILSSADMKPEELQKASQEMVDAEKRMNENPLLQDLKAARKDFQTMMDNVNQLLRLVVTGEVPEEVSATASCGGNCAGCSGCGG